MENKKLEPLPVTIKEEILYEENEDVKNPLDDTKESMNLNPSQLFHTVTLTTQSSKNVKLLRASRKLEKNREVEEVRKQLQKKKYTLMPKEGARSEVWKRFYIIVDAVTDQKTEFVQCIFCKLIRHYTGTTAGTSQLLRHTCDNPKMGPYTKATKQCIKTMLESCVEFCAMDVHPLEIIEGPGFEQLAQNLINLGAKSGRLRIEDILPTQSTLSKRISQEADTATVELFSTVMPYIEKEQGSISLYNWTDETKGMCYTNVTFHYIDENWCFNSCLLFTEFLPKKKYSNECIRKKITQKLMNFSATPELIEEIIFVSDEPCKAFEHLRFYKHMPCAENLFEKVIEKVLAHEYLQEETPKIQHTWTGLDDFVKFINQTGVAIRLPKPIICEEDKSWRGKLRLLTLVVEQSKEIFDVMEACLKQNPWFENLNIVVAQELIEFLKLFKVAIDDLADDQNSNFHLILPWHKKILNYCKERDMNSVEMKKLKTRAEISLTSMFPIDYRHKVATFLWPSVRQMKMLTDAEKTQFMRELQMEIKAIKCEEEVQVEDPLALEEPSTKRKKTHFDQWMESPSEGKY